MQDRFKPNATVAAVICRDNRFLMVEELIDGAARFNQPAGHLEPGEGLIEATLREVLEETGWRVEATGYLGVCVFEAPTGITFLRHTFCAQAQAFDPDQPIDQGIIASHWLTRDEIVARSAQLRSPMILPTIDQYRQGQIQPLAMVSYHR